MIVLSCHSSTRAQSCIKAVQVKLYQSWFLYYQIILCDQTITRNVSKAPDISPCSVPPSTNITPKYHTGPLVIQRGDLRLGCIANSRLLYGGPDFMADLEIQNPSNLPSTRA